MSEAKRSESALTDGLERVCPRKKCGEYNVLKCVRQDGHTGDCCFVGDHENDYPWNKAKKRPNRH